MAHRPFDSSARLYSKGDVRALRALIPYLWPKGQRELRLRVGVAMVLLVLAKLANVYVPILYKEAVDALNGETSAVIAVPIGLIFAYGMLRVLSLAFGELRDAVFAKVSQRAIRQVALATFEHLHRLALRFHLDRQTGGLSRAIERGTKGIEFLLTFMLFNVIPTLVEVLMVCAILWGLFDVWYAAITFGTILCYIVFTLAVTEWRLKYRRRMNEMDSEANTKAIDSLLNYETVKYFGNEAHEARRYDDSMRRYEAAAIRSKTTLSSLNVGQSIIISIGLTGVMLMAGYGVAEGRMTVGDFVLVNTYLIQLYLPLNFLGFVYREIKQSLADMESMFQLIEIEAEVTDPPGAPALAAEEGRVTFDDVSFAYREDRAILKGVSFEVPPSRSLAIVGPSGAGKSTVSRLLFRFYDVTGGAIRIDGQDIRAVTQESLRAAIGIVPQDTVLFNDSIYYNI
ncbi:MAG: ABC transporter ATP-binding protein/permease, partial [Rhodospirillaceae bacterium]|nr:ABC transporter ATP-binding protein/permease [Rhodospirillaceae bacterium]